jgi:enamine deaminase RidA (YjgF/YER057c/UK114 family)
MKLKLVRSQKTTMFKGTPVFQVQAMALVSDEERHLIMRYRLGGDLVYASEQWKQNVATVQATASGGASFLSGLRALAASALNLKITVNGLIDGTTVECKSLDEMLGAEEAIVSACQHLKSFLETAVTFDGREVLLEI